jgi:hypothetical protein
LHENGYKRLKMRRQRQVPVKVGVDIDKTGCHDLPAGIHHPSAFQRLAGGDGRDAAVLDADVRPKAGPAGAVYYGAVAND